MVRPIRLEFPGALYHITSRGDRQEDIYEIDADRSLFLHTLAEVCQRYNWVCYAYCLMSNHYHLLIETPDGNLCQGMRQLNGVYTQAFNRAKRRVGHVFQGRYTGILVDKQNYLMELARYIVLNPVRAQMCHTADQWPWSSYLATAGKQAKPAWLNTDWLLANFGSTKRQAIAAYKVFVAAGKGQPSPWADLRNQVYLGDSNFVTTMQALIDGDKELSEVPSSQRRPMPKTLECY
jgi:putative transposase